MSSSEKKNGQPSILSSFPVRRPNPTTTRKSRKHSPTPSLATVQHSSRGSVKRTCENQENVSPRSLSPEPASRPSSRGVDCGSSTDEPIPSVVQEPIPSRIREHIPTSEISEQSALSSPRNLEDVESSNDGLSATPAKAPSSPEAFHSPPLLYDGYELPSSRSVVVEASDDEEEDEFYVAPPNTYENDRSFEEILSIYSQPPVSKHSPVRT
eukprot:CAMPEP_0184658022 /NCGR_PEP_ID=MMETSP0308-20130426/23331_1 /TAXON_ID=38269 /ORGANISM="Gloeochaete witrockiana, Strain SAG 46.84" /LENGTH=210 /DNA_ID=CAMNT_0027096597 /DNA_START=80 /DNA_END=712 /DNA_ORIENTATION=-